MEKSPNLTIVKSNQSVDIARFYSTIFITLARRNLTAKILGDIKGYPLLLLVPKTIDPNKKSYLVAAGFHGNEIAGPLGLLQFLRTAQYDANVSYLPLVSPTGFAGNSRFNYAGMSPNTGYIHGEEHIPEEVLSEEGELLMQNIDEIVNLAKDGFLTLHEDHTNDQFYLYCFGKGEEKLRALLQRGAATFGMVEEGFYQNIPIKQGFVRDLHDGTFEDLLFHKGIPLAVCTETPGCKDIDLRVTTVVDLIKIFVDAI